MNIPEEAIEKVTLALVDYVDPRDAHHAARAALSAAAPLLMAQGLELGPGELLNLPDGSIVIDKHGNPSRVEDGHLGRFITTDDFPFRVVYIPTKEHP